MLIRGKDMENKKDPFYVFLDFDGVLYDLEYILREKIKKGENPFAFAPDSIEALNKLFKQLSTKYDPNLVISSFWKIVFPRAVSFLQKNGFNVVGVPISKTETAKNPLKRGVAIKQFLEKRDNCENFIIIDDTSFDYAKHFPANKVIKTNILNNRLTEDKLDDVLLSYGLEPISKVQDDIVM
jgi:hypothetical protein